ncbi:MAG TPA: hypothetical protein DCK97_26210, partial [Tistrella mobilis]|nr:hypothetical protein [Tistrella mobilis]
MAEWSAATARGLLRRGPQAPEERRGRSMRTVAPDDTGTRWPERLRAPPVGSSLLASETSRRLVGWPGCRYLRASSPFRNRPRRLMTDPLPVQPPAPPPPPPAPSPARPFDGLWLALGLVTRLPVPAPHGLQPAARFAGWLGPAGLIAGGLAGLVLAGAAEVFADRWIAALLALIAAALIGGLIHEDGLADVADGFGGGRDRAAKLEIMKDSRVGTFGAGALILGFGLRAALYAALAPLGIGAAVLAAGAGGLSRAAIGLAMAWMPP